MRSVTVRSACTIILLAWVAVRPCRADELELSALTGTVAITNDPTTGLYDYTFKLIETNQTGTWQPGQGYGGIVFGDVLYGPSPIADFTLTSVSPNSPWNTLDLATYDGYHNGPIFAPYIDTNLNPIFWYPTVIGDTLSWSGTSANYSTDLTFSTIFTDGADPANFQPFSVVPEPSSLVLGATAIVLVLGFLALRHRHRTRQVEALLIHDNNVLTYVNH